MKTPFNGEAKWIWRSGGNWQVCEKTPVSTCYFRREFDAHSGDSLTLNVSADSRYTLFFNGERLGSGPAKGDIAHQFYDIYNIHEKIITGKNVIAAVVTNYSAVYPNYSGVAVPVSLMTAVPAFIVDAVLCNENGIVETLHTDEKWVSMGDKANTHLINPEHAVISDLNECVDYNFYPKDWEKIDFNKEGFTPPQVLAEGVKSETVVDSPLPFRLLPRMIPLMRERVEPFDAVYFAEGISKDKVEKCIHGGELVIPKRTKVNFVLQIKQTTAFPLITVDKGNGAEITLTYCEGLSVNGMKVPQTEFTKNENISVVGMSDKIICDGLLHHFEPSHWRTFRFIKIEIETKEEDLTISDIKTRFNAFPYDLNCEFESSDRRQSEVMKIAFRTLELCSHETYEDCPYYEQLQYMGDSQVIALIAGMATGNWELQKQLIVQFSWSLDCDGFPQSRYPSRIPQKIISWALLWSVCVADYFQHTGDVETMQLCIDGVTRMLDWFKKYIGERGLLANLPYWKVVDWVREWGENGGAPMGAVGGTSALISSQYAYSLKRTCEILSSMGNTQKTEEYLHLADKIISAINEHSFDSERELYLDSPDHKLSSELANAWAILAGCASDELSKKICMKFISDDSIAKATMYGRFYVFRAMSKCGAYDKIFGSILSLWYEVMKKGLDTFPEEPDFVRSYCHAWSAVPIYEFLTEILGVNVVSKVNKTIEIKPYRCGLKFARGKVPTTLGDIYVEWKVVEDALENTLEILVKVPDDVVIISDYKKMIVERIK